MTDPIPHWPTDERPREKLLRLGAESLSDAELLAIFIRTGVTGKSAVDVGRELLDKHHSLRRILNASIKELTATTGLGPAKCALLFAAREMGGRYTREKLERAGPLTSPSQTAAYFTQRLRDRPREVFAVVYLDNRHRVLDYEELFEGTFNSATVHPREVVRGAMKRNAAAIIVAHNHPSGVAEPSSSDAAITVKLKAALELVEVKLLDHLVIGDGEFVSLSDRGLF